MAKRSGRHRQWLIGTAERRVGKRPRRTPQLPLRAAAARADARDDDAECFDEWSHRTCRYDSTQTTDGMKVRRFNDEKVDGKITFEEHERRTLPCSRVELCDRF